MDESAQVKGIFFDFDGVLTVEKKGTPTMVAYISEKTGLPYDRVETEYRKFNKDLLMGNITHKDMWEPFCRAVGQDIGYEILERSFLNMTLDRQIIKLIREYRKKYLIGMITDNKTNIVFIIL